MMNEPTDLGNGRVLKPLAPPTKNADGWAITVPMPRQEATTISGADLREVFKRAQRMYVDIWKQALLITRTQPSAPSVQWRAPFPAWDGILGQQMFVFELGV